MWLVPENGDCAIRNEWRTRPDGCYAIMMAQLLWTQKQDIGPKARSGLAMEYDVARSRAVLFGGSVAAGIANDTWEWNGEYWTQTADIGPSHRTAHALAYDSNRKRLVMFGGTSSGLEDTLGDTWEWDGEDWTQVADSGPKARMFHSMAYDSKRQRVLLFGGATIPEGGEINLNDTWSWNGLEWTQEQDSGPDGRNGHKIVYDSVRDRVVLFGGVTATRDANDTWEYDGSLWTLVHQTGPEPRGAFGMVCADTSVVLFGGTRLFGPSRVFGDTWTWDGEYWTQRQDIGPAPRANHGMAYDSARQRTVLFGGMATNGTFGDTWEQFERPVST